MAVLAFTSRNPYQQLRVLSDKTAEGLQAQILALVGPIQVISIYSAGTTHYAWIVGKIK